MLAMHMAGVQFNLEARSIGFARFPSFWMGCQNGDDCHQKRYNAYKNPCQYPKLCSVHNRPTAVSEPIHLSHLGENRLVIGKSSIEGNFPKWNGLVQRLRPASEVAGQQSIVGFVVS
jgi:hypothetical protein